MAEVAQAIGRGPQVAMGAQVVKIQLKTKDHEKDSIDDTAHYEQGRGPQVAMGAQVVKVQLKAKDHVKDNIDYTAHYELGETRDEMSGGDPCGIASKRFHASEVGLSKKPRTGASPGNTALIIPGDFSGSKASGKGNSPNPGNLSIPGSVSGQGTPGNLSGQSTPSSASSSSNQSPVATPITISSAVPQSFLFPGCFPQNVSPHSFHSNQSLSSHSSQMGQLGAHVMGSVARSVMEGAAPMLQALLMANMQVTRELSVKTSDGQEEQTIKVC